MLRVYCARGFQSAHILWKRLCHVVGGAGRKGPPVPRQMFGVELRVTWQGDVQGTDPFNVKGMKSTEYRDRTNQSHRDRTACCMASTKLS